VFPQVIAADGQVMRDQLAQRVFNDANARRMLNRIMKWPILKLLLKLLFGGFVVRGQKTVFLVAPLLFESGLNWICDHVICVAVDPDVQLGRLMKRDQCDQQFAKSKIESQMNLAEKIRKSNHVVWNNIEGVEHLEAQAQLLVSRFGDLSAVEHEVHEDEDDEHESEAEQGKKSLPPELEELISSSSSSNSRRVHIIMDWSGKRESLYECLFPTRISLLLSILCVSTVAVIHTLVSLLD
jgi:dephospho-CoA kinase